MFNVISSAREFNGHWVMALRGELDLAGAPTAAAHLSAAVAGHGPRAGVDMAGVEYIGPSGRGVLDHAVRCPWGSGDQRQRRRTCTRPGPATPTRWGPNCRDLTPPARTIVGLSFRLDPQDEKGLRPAQAISASVPAVSAYEGVAVPAARPKRRAFPGRADQIANARDFTRRVLASCPMLDEAMLLVGELATNAVVHTATGSGGQFDVMIYRDETLIVIVVTDEGSDNAPATRPHNELAEDGRGLRSRRADRRPMGVLAATSAAAPSGSNCAGRTPEATQACCDSLAGLEKTRPAAALVASPGGDGRSLVTTSARTTSGSRPAPGREASAGADDGDRVCAMGFGGSSAVAADKGSIRRLLAADRGAGRGGAGAGVGW